MTQELDEGQVEQEATRREVAEAQATYAVQSSDLPPDELRRLLLDIQDNITEVKQRLSSLEARLAEVVELQPSVQSMEQILRRLSGDDYGWLTLAEKSFEFWDNDEDAVYDTL